MKIKKGDHVIVVAGRDRGREGTVIAAYPDRQRVLVQGVNMVKKNTKVTQGIRGAKEGGIVHSRSADPREQCADRRPGHEEAGPRRLPRRLRRQEGPGCPAER